MEGVRELGVAIEVIWRKSNRLRRVIERPRNTEERY